MKDILTKKKIKYTESGFKVLRSLKVRQVNLKKLFKII